jgi:cell division protein ZapA
MQRRNKVLIKINGQEYPIAGNEPKEYLLKVGSFVDEKMEEIAMGNSRLSTSMIAVLTSINIADLYLKLKDEHERLQNQSFAPLNELDRLKEELQQLLKQLDEKEAACTVIEEELARVLSQQESYHEDYEKTKQMLEVKDMDLKKAEEIINDLHNKLFENQIKLVEARKQLEGYIQQSEAKYPYNRK